MHADLTIASFLFAPMLHSTNPAMQFDEGASSLNFRHTVLAPPQ
jgi:hypothetical protein